MASASHSADFVWWTRMLPTGIGPAETIERRLISTLQNNTREQSRSCLLKHIREVDSQPKKKKKKTLAQPNAIPAL